MYVVQLHRTKSEVDYSQKITSSIYQSQLIYCQYRKQMIVTRTCVVSVTTIHCNMHIMTGRQIGEQKVR